MRTLVKPVGAAGRAALGGITAGLVLGLAACGTTVAGAAASGSTPAPPPGNARRSRQGDSIWPFYGGLAIGLWFLKARLWGDLRRMYG